LRAAIGLPSITGQYLLNNECVHFRPQFPFQPGVRYRATFSPPGQKTINSAFHIPLPKREPTTVVTEIYPTTNALPENLLKFYLYFSAPMSGGHIYEHIQLTDERGTPVELPFLEIDEELWTADMTRLTLFLDPGRIKTGVKPLEEVGPALQEGKRYRLTISRSWLDASGTPLKQSFEKKFQVIAADRSAPDLSDWKFSEPKAGTREPLRIEFSDPMDHALALRMIRVENVEGDSKASANETVWSFTPEQPWRAGKHRLVVQSTIEDLAGNNIGKPFEVDLFSGVDKRIVHETVARDFVVN
ncbi:MAG: Ig-like domain-containing protein, partial [Limisphaerales bacterium]